MSRPSIRLRDGASLGSAERSAAVPGRLLFTAILAALFATACSSSQGSVADQASAEELAFGEPAPTEVTSPREEEARDTGRLSDRFPNIELRTHRGDTVRFYDDLVRNRCVLVNFMYTRCDGI